MWTAAALAFLALTSPQDPVEPIRERGILVAVLGDSTSAPRPGQVESVWPERLVTRMEGLGTHVRMVNASRPRETTAGARARLHDAALGWGPDVLVIQLGINDSAVDVSQGRTEPRVSREDYRANLAHIVAECQEAGAMPVLMTPNPVLWTAKLKALYGEPPYDTEDRWGWNVLLEGYAADVRALAEREAVPCVDVYGWFREVDRDGDAGELLLDGMHPNDESHAVLSRTVAGVLLRQMETGELRVRALPPRMPPGYTIPLIDLAGETGRQVVVDREAGQYLGHPTTVLLEDGKTMIAVYPKGHGRGAIVMKRSTDGGRTWSERLPTPASWATSKEVPTIYRVVDAAGKKRLIVFSGLYPIRMAHSEDDGATWSELEPIGDYGGVVANASLAEIGPGEYVSWFHDDGRFIGDTHRPPADGRHMHLYQIRSNDGGLTWSAPEVIATHPVAHICEPGLVWSPDGETMALLLRENSRRLNSFVVFSSDRGKTWTEPRELPAALTGDRHTAVYAPDGRLFVSFRDTTRESPTQGDWVAWVGTWEDIVEGREGQYRVRLEDNRHAWDCAYPGVVALPDGTIVTTTYGHWVEGEPPFILSVRLRLGELDARAGR